MDSVTLHAIWLLTTGSNYGCACPGARALLSAEHDAQLVGILQYIPAHDNPVIR